jgi:4-hydroxy-3-methylbut-2-enyl diphosphate reductase
MIRPVVCTPLVAERASMLGALPDLEVVRTGQGLRRAAARARDLSDRKRAVLVAGVAGATGAGLDPGDVVVASEVRAPDGVVTPIPGSALLAASARRHGLRVHHGPLASVQTLAEGRARRDELAAAGVLAIDMETSAFAGFGPALAALRTIVDTPAQPLARLGTVARGIGALRSLRASAPVIEEWSRAVGTRDVLLAEPRSFCAGVGRAIEIVERSLDRYGAPVYVRRQIVHNAHVVRGLERRGVVFVEEVEEIPEGSLVVLAAHGVSPQVRSDAAGRGLRVIDATCPLVTKVHNEVRRYASRGDTVFLIGHREHEEVVGTVGEAPGRVRVVADVAEAATVQVEDPDRVAYVMQTTLAVDEATEVAEALRQRFPLLNAPRRDDICYATTNRQRSVREIARASDLVLVVGSANSSNSRRLVEVAEREGARSYLVDDAGEVDLRWLVDAGTIGITAGASAPQHLVDELVDTLTGLGPVTVRDTPVVDEDVEFTLPKEVL